MLIPEGAELRVLVVYDERRMAGAICRGLEAEGFVVEVAYDGEDALHRATEVGFDAIVLDILLPKLSGYDVCRRLRAKGVWTPILMLSAKDGEYDQAARAAANQAFTDTLLGLGAIALLVGGVGVANTMVISVLERRKEIGLRRSLGATRGQVRTQFLAESLLLSFLGGVSGVVLGAAATTGYALVQRLPVALPWWVLTAAFAATVLVGSVAGLYPAVRAARVSPTVALATS